VIEMTRTYEIDPAETLTVRSNTPGLLEMEATFEPGGHAPPKHWHPDQDEHFEVLEGTLTATVGGRELVLRAGETLDIPRGTVHAMWNAGTERARVRWQVRPAGRTEQWFASVAAMRAQHGKLGPLAYAVLLTEFHDVFRPVLPAAPVVRAVFAALAPIGRLRGYRVVSTVDGATGAPTTRA
jgi:quercetin dioxygenase-like cupin family protein